MSTVFIGMFHFAFPFQSFCVLVSVLKNEEQFCITGCSVLNQRTSERKLMVNHNYGRMIPYGLVYFALHYLGASITNRCTLCTSAAMTKPTVLWGYSGVKEGSVAFEECCTEFFCVRSFYMFTNTGTARRCCFLDTKYLWMLYWPCPSSVLDAPNFCKALFDSVGAALLWCCS